MGNVFWDKWRDVLELIKRQPSKRVKMRYALENFKTKELHKDLKSAVKDCGTVGCIAGWTVAACCPMSLKIASAAAHLDNPSEFFREEMMNALNLDQYDADYVFMGRWSSSGLNAGKNQVVRYMTKALKQHDVRVSI